MLRHSLVGRLSFAPLARARCTSFEPLRYDHNKNGRLDAADKPIVNSAVEIRFLNNTLLKKVKTDAKGHFEFEYNRAPFAKLVIIGLSGKIRKTFRADGNGNAKIEIPLMPVIPKGTISALVYVDINGNQKMDGSEPGAAEISLDLKFAANGTFFRRVKTDTTGRFSILSVNLPNTKFQVVGPDGSTILGFITTDGQGTGTNVFYIPPSTIRATIFYDENRDGQYMDGERLLANANIEVRRKDGTIVAKVKTGSNGQFSLSVVPMNKAELQVGWSEVPSVFSVSWG